MSWTVRVSCQHCGRTYTYPNDQQPPMCPLCEKDAEVMVKKAFKKTRKRK